MSLTQEVHSVLLELDQATLSDFERLFPKLERRQLCKALQNLQQSGRAVRLKRGLGGPGSRRESLWGPAFPKKPQPKEEKGRPPASVWELGENRTGIWPPIAAGRQFQPLGGWNEI